MLTKEKIIEAVIAAIGEQEIFLVDILLLPDNHITVFLDSMDGLTIEQCSYISRTMQPMLDKHSDEYLLDVSSPGLDMPLRHPAQYLKNKGRMISVLLHSGTRIDGKLSELNDGSIIVNTEVKKKNGKKKYVEQVQHTISISDIKTTKLIL